MSETYVPRPGDRVRFYSWAAQMDLYGEVLSVAPQSRLATVREDDEEGNTCVKSWDVLRLDQEAPSSDEWRAIVAATVERAEKAEAALVQQIDATSTHFRRVRELDKRLTNMEADRDGWVQEANDNQYISRMGYEERDQARARVKELEDQNRRLKTVLNLTNDDVTHYRQHSAKLDADLIEARNVAGDCEARAEKAEARVEELQAQIDAAPHATGYPVGDKVAARIAEYRERTHAAEDERDELRKEWLAAEERVFELGHELAELKAALRTLAGER